LNDWPIFYRVWRHRRFYLGSFAVLLFRKSKPEFRSLDQSSSRFLSRDNACRCQALLR
jgi:hypothetical protein